MRVAVFFVLLLAVSIPLMMRAWHPGWWRRAWVRRATVGASIAAIVVGVVRTFVVGSPKFHGVAEGMPTATIALSVATGISTVTLLALFVSLPLAALVRAVGRAVLLRGVPREVHDEAPSEAPAATEEDPATADAPAAARDAASPEPPAETPSPTAPPAEPSRLIVPRAPALVLPRHLTRRRVLEAAAVSVPALALGTGATGLLGAFRGTAIVERRMRFANLPPGLEGLRILQLTDLHLGAYMDPAGVADILERAREARPDLVVLTGDIVDHVPWLAPALEAVERLDAPLGALAVMGNHEHYRGPSEVRHAYAKSRVELLDDRHVTLDVRGTPLVVAGVDDPARRRGGDFYERAIDRALDGSPSEAFRLGLCHRPSPFRTLAERGIDLQLSGHTHGAQMGTLAERSLLEPLAPDAFLWGRYQHAGKQLYTSSGGGHWFAFRLACPSEAALIVLERA